MASTGQALAHLPQRMHKSFFCTTPPPCLRGARAPVGQASAQGGGSQARQTLASKPVDTPPAVDMRIPAANQDRRLCTSRAQASEQE